MNNKNNRGLGIAIGVGLGAVFGEAVFGNVGVGIALGAALGIAYSSQNQCCKRESNSSNKR